MAPLSQLARGAMMASGMAALLVAPVALADKKEDAAAKAMFDPEALERGAKSLREINKSPYAKQVSWVQARSGDWRLWPGYSAAVRVVNGLRAGECRVLLLLACVPSVRCWVMGG